MSSLQLILVERLLRLFRNVQRFSHWFERRLTPAGSLVGGALIAGAILGIDTRISLAYVIFAIAFSLLLVSFSARRRISPHLQLKRHLPQFVTVGIPARYRISIENNSANTIAGLTLQDRLQQTYPQAEEFINWRNFRSRSRRTNWFDQMVGYPDWLEWLRNLRAVKVTPVAVPKLHPGQSLTIELELAPIHRGVASFEYFGIARADPLGLWQTIRDLPAGDSLPVLPRIYPVRWPNFRGRRQHQCGGISQALRVGDSEEFRALRDYRPGDPLRAIHWRSWARVGHPVVKEYQEEYFSRYALILDTERIHYADDIFEALITIVASFTVSQPGVDSFFDLLFIAGNSSQSAGNVTKITIGRGLGDSETALRVLASVQPSPQNSFTNLAQTVISHIGIISGAIVILQCWDAIRARFVTQLKMQDIGIKIYVPKDRIAPDCPFPAEGQLIDPRCLGEILLHG